MSTYLSSLANGLDVGYYVYDYDRETASYTSTACDSYTLYFRPMTGAEIQEEQFWEKVERARPPMRTTISRTSGSTSRGTTPASTSSSSATRARAALPARRRPPPL